MKCGRLTAKLRDVVPVCFISNDRTVKHYKSIKILAEIKRLEYCVFWFDIPKDGKAITFKIWFNEGILPEIWPAERERQYMAVKEESVNMMELAYGVTDPDRKTLVAVISTITGIEGKYHEMPSQALKIGDYSVSKEGTLAVPESPVLIAWLAVKRFDVKLNGKRKPTIEKNGGRCACSLI